MRAILRTAVPTEAAAKRNAAHVANGRAEFLVMALEHLDLAHFDPPVRA